MFGGWTNEETMAAFQAMTEDAWILKWVFAHLPYNGNAAEMDYRLLFDSGGVPGANWDEVAEGLNAKAGGLFEQAAEDDEQVTSWDLQHWDVKCPKCGHEWKEDLGL